jgi:hypothetical protein
VEGELSCIELMTNAYKTLIGKPEGKTPRQRIRKKLECSVNTGSIEIGRFFRFHRDMKYFDQLSDS